MRTPDFDDGNEAFQSMNLNSALAFIHFAAKGKLKKPNILNILRVGYNAEAVGKWIHDRTERQRSTSACSGLQTKP